MYLIKEVQISRFYLSNIILVIIIMSDTDRYMEICSE